MKRRGLNRWFIGFMDAEGNFQTFKKKRVLKSGKVYYNVGYGIHLSLHERELNLLRYLKKELNLPGKIYEYPHRSEVHLAIVRLEDMKYVLFEVFGEYPLLKEQIRENYMRLKYGILNRVNRLETEGEFKEFYENKTLWKDNGLNKKVETLDIHSTDFAYWVKGFISGEGSFYIRPNGKTKEFCMEQVDRKVMELIKQRLGFKTSIIVKDRREDRYKSKVCYEIRISSRNDIENLIGFLEGKEGSLLGNKLEQYLMWRYK